MSTESDHQTPEIAPDEFPVAYEELREIARQFLLRERSGHSLQPTELVHEAWIRLANDTGATWQNQTEFSVLVARTMRQILVDHARSREAYKRGNGARRLTLYGGMIADNSSEVLDLLELDDALSRLATLNPGHAQVVELRYFAGLSVEETATTLGISDWTAKNDWRTARAWLMTRFERPL